MAQPLTVSDLELRLGETRRLIAEKWGWFLALGIVLILAGLAAIAFPLLGTIAVKIMLGWLFLIGGVVMIMHAFQAPGWQGFLWELLGRHSLRRRWRLPRLLPAHRPADLGHPAGGAVHRRRRLRGDPGRSACARTRAGASCC